MHRHIPGIMGQGIHDLETIANPREEGTSGDLIQEPVIISAAMAQAIPLQVKSHARDHMKVNFFRLDGIRMILIRLQDAIIVLHKAGLEIVNLARQKVLGLRNNLGNDQAFSPLQNCACKTKGVRLPGKGKIGHNGLGPGKFRERKERVCDQGIVSAAFPGIEQPKAFPIDVPQILLVMSYGIQ